MVTRKGCKQPAMRVGFLFLLNFWFNLYRSLSS
uniref:Uncharacterized protein n=1 Tax=Rhizophora mucronata TaxID=61149 RepID=A0A2P2NLL4_RHIMU